MYTLHRINLQCRRSKLNQHQCLIPETLRGTRLICKYTFVSFDLSPIFSDTAQNHDWVQTPHSLTRGKRPFLTGRRPLLQITAESPLGRCFIGNQFSARRSSCDNGRVGWLVPGWLREDVPAQCYRWELLNVLVSIPYPFTDL